MGHLKTLIVIPARFASSRLPGKPLADIHGHPMIEHVWRRCCVAVPAENIVVATDSEQIADTAQRFGAEVELTSSDCQTGSDRVAEVATRRSADWYLNVQGDEPLIEPSSILSIIEHARTTPKSVIALNAMSPIASETDFRSGSVPKVVTDFSDFLLYISRSPIPAGKHQGFSVAWRQVGLYAYRPEALTYFAVGAKRQALETIEDIEILRLLENGESVKMVRVPEANPAVDTPDDLERVRQIVLGSGGISW